MGLVRRVAEMAYYLDIGARAASRLATESERLERIQPFAGGGGGTVQTQNRASSVGPGVAGVPVAGEGPGMPDLTGRSLSLGGNAGETGAEGGATGGVISPETNRDKIGAIVAESGVAPPAKEDWDGNGLGPGIFAGLIFATVLEFGVKAPTAYLVWCAGWLVYSAAATTARLGSRNSGNGGFRAGTGGWTDTGSANKIPYFDRGHGAPFDFTPGRLPQGRSDGSTAGGITASQAKSIASATGKTATATENLVTAVRDLTTTVKAGQNSVGARAGGFA